MDVPVEDDPVHDDNNNKDSDDNDEDPDEKTEDSTDARDRWIYWLVHSLNKIYLRFIDDIFMLWIGTLNELKDFEHTINQVHPSIKLTFEYSFKEINFLDTTIVVSPNGRLTTKVFKKPTDRSSYLHNTSHHPNSLKNNIPYGQALRLRKIC